MKKSTLGDDTILKVNHVSKTFRLPTDRRKSLKQAVLSFGRTDYEEFKVLRDISFEVKRGEFFGILGRNGSGKSTLLKIISNIYSPTEGGVELGGDLTPFIELGIGFNLELSGKDNVYLNGAILGLTKKQIQEKYDEIVQFSELEKFMEQKLRNYSSGMLVRLAFAIAIQAHNDILLIDEVLAVGDANFQQKCLNVFRQLRRSGKTIILVTHDMGAVEEFCDRAILIEDGRITMEGAGRDVANRYRRINFEQLTDDDRAQSEEKVMRWGNKAATVNKVWVSNKPSAAKTKLISAREFTLSIDVKYNTDLQDPITGFQIIDASGQIIIGLNSKISHFPKTDRKKGDHAVFEWTLPNILKSGTYFVSATLHDYGGEPYDWWVEAISFVVEKEEDTSALVLTEHKLNVKEKK
jgi:ABC-2 type transport system ATP-binding protein